ncbi:MAG: hypothetical protein RR448_07065 [Niameybacter sp.]|uniref:hypothetical protein n=1 Tax=Niameybacter sp. TaxID=2033640 RepID=UPI002FCA19C5
MKKACMLMLVAVSMLSFVGCAAGYDSTTGYDGYGYGYNGYGNYGTGYKNGYDNNGGYYNGTSGYGTYNKDGYNNGVTGYGTKGTGTGTTVTPNY